MGYKAGANGMNYVTQNRRNTVADRPQDLMILESFSGTESTSERSSVSCDGGSLCWSDRGVFEELGLGAKKKSQFAIGRNLSLPTKFPGLYGFQG